MERYRGRFNVAGEARQVAGAVAVEPTTRRISLELDDAFEDTDRLEFVSYSAVHGELIDGSPVTLLSCDQTRAGKVPGAVDGSAAVFHCRFWIKGSHLLGADTFSRLDFALTDLLPWIGQRGFTTHSDLTGSEPVFTLTTLPRYIATASTKRGEVRFLAGPKVEARYQSAHFGTAASVEIVPNRAITLKDAFSCYVRPFQDLLTIATGRAQEVVRLRLVPSKLIDLGQDPRDRYDWVEVRFRRWTDAVPTDEAPLKDEMLFSLSDLDRSLSDSLDAWFRIDEEIREVRSLATAAAYRSGMFVDQKFLNAAHALESYHRRRIGGQARPKAEHKAIIKAIVEAVPDQHRAWLRDKLAFSNELMLLQRLRELRARVCDRVESTLALADKWDEWTRDTRNFNTHFTKRSPPARVAKGKQLLALTESLLLVLDDLILADLGVSEFARNSLLAGTKRFRRVSQWFQDCDWSPP